MKRRRFMKLVAAGAAIALVQPGRTLAAVAKRPAAEPHPMSPATRKEIASEKKSVADTLKTIRGYKLPPGSRLAFVFRAEKRSADRA